MAKRVRGRQKKPRLTDPINVSVEVANKTRELSPYYMDLFPREVTDRNIELFNICLNLDYPKGGYRTRFNKWVRYIEIFIDSRKQKELRETEKLLRETKNLLRGLR